MLHGYRWHELRGASWERGLVRIGVQERTRTHGTLQGHRASRLYRDAFTPASYLIVSEWDDVSAFEAFTHSEKFLKVTSWGRDQILAGLPRHEVYGATAKPLSGGCPVAH